MGFKNILLIASALPSLIQCFGIDFSSLAPSVPPLITSTYNETTGYPNEGQAVRLDDEHLDYKTIALNYLEEQFPGLTFEVNSITESKEFYTVTVNLVQTSGGKKINNSYVTVNIDNRDGIIFDSNKSVWENASFQSGSTNGNIEKEIVSSLKEINKTFSLSEESNWDSVKVSSIGSEQYSIENVPFSQSVIARKIYTVKENESETKGIMVWEFTFEYNGVYNTISYDFTNKKPINGFESRSNLKYKVYPFSKFTKHELVDVVDPVNEYIGLSPLGWHKLNDDVSSRVTLGNNVIAQEYKTKYTFAGTKNMVFDGTNCNNTKDCYNKYNKDITLNTMFYFGNMLHDIFYNLGFDEQSGNFQQNNFGKGGKENDAVIMNYYDEDCSTEEKKKNNPLCEVDCPSTSTTRDGIPAIIRFPVLDMEQGRVGTGISSHIAIHEYTHAVTHRLTGGPNYDCFVLGDNVDGSSLSEGFSDFFSDALQFDKNSGRDRNTEFLLDHVWDKNNIISSKQEYKYSDLKHIRDDELSYYFGATVWRLMLHDVFWNIVDNFPSSDDYFKVYNSREIIPGNILLLKIIVKALSVQGCNPDFIRARNAIITVMERNPYTAMNYKFQCLVWKGFADRGLGYNAHKPIIYKGKYTYVDNFDLPEFCQNEKF